ncbi:MAG: hypothetical protein WC136_01405 [Sphaerochaeta sp.]
MKIESRIGIEIHDEFISKEYIQKLGFGELKMILSFIDNLDTLHKVASWHSDKAIHYAQELDRNIRVI